MNNFPQYAVGLAVGIYEDYQVHWLEKDLVQLTVYGEAYTTFCSKNPGGFTDLDDVLDQAQDVVYEFESDWRDVNDW